MYFYRHLCFLFRVFCSSASWSGCRSLFWSTSYVCSTAGLVGGHLIYCSNVTVIGYAVCFGFVNVLLDVIFVNTILTNSYKNLTCPAIYMHYIF